MKVTTEKINVPAAEYEKTTYSCDVPGCTFSTMDETDAKKHHGLQHAVKERAMIDDIEFLRFESQSDFEAWFDANNKSNKSHQSLRNKKWSGPGWYGLKGCEESCAAGCCTVWNTYVYSAREFVMEWDSEIRERQSKIEDLEKLVGVAS